MKYFAIATLLAGSILVGADLSAQEYIPWHWDDEETTNVDQQQSEEIRRQLQEYAEWLSGEN